MDKSPQYFILKDGPEHYCGDLLIKFDGIYSIWIEKDKVWFPDPTLFKTHWDNCTVRLASDEEVEEILPVITRKR